MKAWITVALLFFVSQVYAEKCDEHLKDDMTYWQAVQAMGGESGKKIAEYKSFGNMVKIYKWEKCKTVLLFRDDKLKKGESLSIFEQFAGVDPRKSQVGPEDASILDKYVDTLGPDIGRDICFEKYDLIQAGMTAKELTNLLGNTNIRCTQYKEDIYMGKPKTVKLCQWYNEGNSAYVNVVFLNDIVIGKGQVDLDLRYHNIELTLEKYDQIDIGTDYWKVLTVLGYPNKTDESKDLKTCLWTRGESVEIAVSFKDNKVTAKRQKGVTNKKNRIGDIIQGVNVTLLLMLVSFIVGLFVNLNRFFRRRKRPEKL